jgi:tetratricopeptide (TPR) repeat protein
VADIPEPPPLGRHGTSRTEPWHRQWIELRDTLRLVGQLTQAQKGGNEVATSRLLTLLASAPAASSYATPELDEQGRGRWIAATIRDVAETLYHRLLLPLNDTAADQHTILFWYLTVCEGQTLGEIVRRLSKYVAGKSRGKQWVAERMWATGNRFNAKAAEGLAELTRQTYLRLGATAPGGGADDATATLVREALDRLFLEDSAAASWMALLAYFSPDPIPLEPLAVEVPRGLPHVRGRLDLQPMGAYIDALVTNGLVTRVHDESFAVRPSVARAVLNYLDPDLRQRALRAAIVLLGMAFPAESDEQWRWLISELLVSHVTSIASYANQVHRAAEDAAILFRRASRYYRARASFDLAIETAQRAIAAAERAFGRSSPALAGFLSNLAWVFMNDGQRTEAEELFLRALALEKDEQSRTPAERADTLNLYGNLLKSMERLSEAETVQRRALSLLDRDNPSYWITMHDLGRTLLDQDHPEDALALFHEALMGLRGTGGERIAKRNIGTTLNELGRFKEARDCLEELLADQESQEVPDEGFIAWVVRPLGNAYQALGDPRAEEMFRRLAELDQPWVL